MSETECPDALPDDDAPVYMPDGDEEVDDYTVWNGR